MPFPDRESMANARSLGMPSSLASSFSRSVALAPEEEDDDIIASACVPTRIMGAWPARLRIFSA